MGNIRGMSDYAKNGSFHFPQKKGHSLKESLPNKLPQA
jgi:hypothetical protein